MLRNGYSAQGTPSQNPDPDDFNKWASLGAQMEQHNNQKQAALSSPQGFTGPVDHVNAAEQAHMAARMLGLEDVVMTPKIIEKLQGFAPKAQRIQEARQRYLEDPTAYEMQTANDLDGYIAAWVQNNTKAGGNAGRATGVTGYNPVESSPMPPSPVSAPMSQPAPGRAPQSFSGGGYPPVEAPVAPPPSPVAGGGKTKTAALAKGAVAGMASGGASSGGGKGENDPAKIEAMMRRTMYPRDRKQKEFETLKAYNESIGEAPVSDMTQALAGEDLGKRVQGPDGMWYVPAPGNFAQEHPVLTTLGLLGGAGVAKKMLKGKAKPSSGKLIGGTSAKFRGEGPTDRLNEPARNLNRPKPAPKQAIPLSAPKQAIPLPAAKQAIPLPAAKQAKPPAPKPPAPKELVKSSASSRKTSQGVGPLESKRVGPLGGKKATKPPAPSPAAPPKKTKPKSPKPPAKTPEKGKGKK